ncbi:hypothetical protein LFL96_11195 [Paraburkholderia sp. D15]|uniref:hypothetical protein n=1 Tax=Paraburkholderia sp. D15 TaxID=2880218 RepID=UPI00247A2C3C|nr:hypothetical protein [Paraburkholderia sp. D15]WGS48367.1 hypothetical protein LFL96_11195 [Paraburkholderia sp. D15]
MSVADRFGALRAAWSSVFGGRPRAKPAAVGVDAAPSAWVSYAQQVALCLQTALADDEASASRLAGFFERQANAATAGQHVPVLRLKTWLDARGRVERIECVQGGEVGLEEELEAELAALVVGRQVGLPPPRDMIQPVVVRLETPMERERSPA